MVERADVVVGMTAAHVAASAGAGGCSARRIWTIPSAGGRDTYRRVYAQIETDVRRLFA